MSAHRNRRRGDRGQLVLLAAAVLAVALVPVLFAYLQLGYHGDVAASSDYDAPARNAEQFLQRTVHEAGAGIAENYSWAERRDAVDVVRNRLDEHLETLETARIDSGTATLTTYNQTAAQAWADTHCPDGPDRQFGGCEARRGVVVQERLGETHVLAVALDVTITRERSTWQVTFVERTSSR